MLHKLDNFPHLQAIAALQCNSYVARVEDALYRATTQVIAEVGWDGLTLDRVAELAGKSRVTLWRNGITRESLLDGLLRQLATDYRDVMLPVLVAVMTPRER